MRFTSLPMLRSGCLLLLSALTGLAETPSTVVHWSASLNPARTEVNLTAKLKPGWHMYSITQPAGGPTATKISAPSGGALAIKGTIEGTKPEKKFDPSFNMETETYANSAEFRVPVAVSTDVKQAGIDVRFQVCDNRICLPPSTAHVAIPGFEPLSATAKPAAAATSVASAAPSPGAEPVAKNVGDPAGNSLLGYIWLAMGFGALSLLTPCVFPMVPITVSFFSNHGSQTRAGAIRQAVVYMLGIVLTFSALGMALAIIFGAGGVNQLAANPWVNLLITLIFVAFAFSLFGAYLIQLPTGLMTRLNMASNSIEGGWAGPLLMGLTFSLTSFTCTAPFVGTLLVAASQGNWRWPLAGMLAYSTVFALPFFALALAPQLVSQLPKAGGWMNSVKVVMGFLEIAAAMKFLSNADLIWRWNIFTREVVLAVWIATGLMIVLYLFGIFRFEHDTPPQFVSAWRAIVALVILAASIALVPGLFGRPLGELESFLPPPTEESTQASATSLTGAGQTATADAWILNNLAKAQARARELGKPVFIDFTGYTCTNCRWMEANVFPKSAVREQLGKFVLLRLYTDGEGAVFDRQQKYQSDTFKTIALPLYVILDENGRTVSTFGGITRQPEEFARFLENGFGRAKNS